MKQAFAYDFVSLGEILVEFTPAGEGKGGAALFQRNLGGAPVNVACAVAKLGWKAAFIGKAGDDGFGAFCKEELLKRGVEAGGLVLSGEQNTTLSFVHLSASGDRSFSFYRKNCADVSLLKKDTRSPVAIGGGRVFHFGSVSLTEEPARSATLDAVARAKRRGSLISYDPNLRFNLWHSPLEEIRRVALSGMEHADVLKMSGEEAEFLFETDDHYKALAYAHERYGVNPAFVTLGSGGALALANGHLYEAPAYDIPVADTTGAGDCFLAGALHCLLHANKPVAEFAPGDVSHMLAFANAAGSLACAKMGAVAGQPTVAAVNRCVAQNRVFVPEGAGAD